jgi:hypothetical protein
MLRGTSAGSYSILADASTNWNTSYGWGNHASAGYLTSVTAHTIDGATHTLASSTAGFVLRATAATTFAFGTIGNTSLANLGTAGTLVKFGATALADSVIQESAGGSIGIGIAPDASMKLDINGGIRCLSATTTPTSGTGIEFYYETISDRAYIVAGTRTAGVMTTQKAISVGWGAMQIYMSGGTQASHKTGFDTITPLCRLDIRDNATDAGVLVRILGDDNSPYLLMLGNAIYNTGLAVGLSFYVENNGDGYISNTAAGKVLYLNTFAGQVAFHAGTALLPAITKTGDLNTGIWYPNADTWAVSTAGVERVRIDANGNILFPTDGAVTSYGVNSEVTLTHVHNTGLLLNTTMALQFRDSALYISSKNDGYLDFDADTAFRFNTGNVSIGTTPTMKLTLPTYSFIGWNYAADAQSRAWGMRNDNNEFGDWALMTESAKGSGLDTIRLYVNHLGNIGVGTTPTMKLTLPTYSFVGWNYAADAQSRAWGMRNDNNEFGDWALMTESAKGSGLDTIRLYVNHLGYVGIQTTAPKSPLHVVGLSIYANNAAAVAAGLTAGAFYRTGADPDLVCVVH